MTIRSSSNSLLVILGVALLLSLAVHIYQGILYYRELGRLIASNLAREHLARATTLLGDERASTYLQLLSVRVSQSDRDLAEKHTNTELDAASALAGELDDTTTGTMIQNLSRALSDQRDIVDQALAGGSMISGRDVPADVYRAYSSLIERIIKLRQSMLARDQPPDAQVAIAFQLRRSVGVVLEQLSRSRTLIVGMIEEPTGSREALMAEVTKISDQEELTFDAIADLAGIEDVAIRERIETFVTQNKAQLMWTQRALMDGLATGKDPRGLYVDWTQQMGLAQQSGLELQEKLFDFSTARLLRERADALGIVVIWLALYCLCTAICFLSLRFVQRRVVQPLADLRSNMLRLAQGDLEVDLHRAEGRVDEIGSMADALRVFKATALRRSRLQEVRRGAARAAESCVSADQRGSGGCGRGSGRLPTSPGEIGIVRFVGHHEPSHYIAGIPTSLGRSLRTGCLLSDRRGWPWCCGGAFSVARITSRDAGNPAAPHHLVSCGHR